MSQLTDKVVKVAVQGSMDGQQEENLFYVQVAETVTAAIVEEVAGIFATWVAGTMLGLLSNSYTHERIVATDQTTDPGLQFINVDNAGDHGAQTTQAEANNVTFAVHRNTGMSGKAAKSRVYWPTIETAMLAGINSLSSTSANQLVNALETLRIAVLAGTGGTYEYGYISRVLGGVLRSVGLFIAVTGHSYTDLFLDSQRRRLPGRGV